MKVKQFIFAALLPLVVFTFAGYKHAFKPDVTMSFPKKSVRKVQITERESNVAQDNLGKIISRHEPDFTNIYLPQTYLVTPTLIFELGQNAKYKPF